MNAITRTLATLAAGLLLALPARAQEGEGDVVYVPTPQHVVEAMLDMAKIGPADFIVDLGSGDGRVVITAAKRYGARGFGVDLDRYLLKRAKETARDVGVSDRATFNEQNLFETDLSKATVVSSYLLPEMNLRLRPKLLALRPGTRIIAHDYDMGKWTPDDQKVLDVPGKTVGDPGKSHIFLYIVPARMAGEWQSSIALGKDPAPYRFSFDQEFQFVEGTVRVGNREGKVPEFRLVGDRLEFNARLIVQGRVLDHTFSGQVKGERIEGEVTLGQGAARRKLPWRAELVQAREISDGSDRPPRQYRHLKQ